MSFPDLIRSALLFQILLEHFDGHVVGALVDVDELRKRAGLRDGFCGGNECVRHCEDNITGLTPQVIRAKRKASVPLLTAIEWLGVAESRERLSKSSTIGPPMKPAVRKARRNTPVSSCF